MANTAPKKDLIDEAQRLATALVEVKHKLAENECEFVLSMDEKLRRYGYGAYVSGPQLNWLRILHRQHAPDPRQGGLFFTDTFKGDP